MICHYLRPNVGAGVQLVDISIQPHPAGLHIHQCVLYSSLATKGVLGYDGWLLYHTG